MCAIRTLDKSPGIFIGDKSTLSSESMLHKDYDRKGSAGGGGGGISGREPQGAWRQDELLGDKPPTLK
jgi:hypothetical protein